MLLRESSRDEFTFIWKAANFDRYRGGSQSFLFRPGVGGLLALQDIFFRHNIWVIGTLSLILLALVSALLLWLLGRVLPWWGALLGATIFEVHFCGSELIVWRHVNPYAWGLILFTGGLVALVHRRLLLASVLLSLSPLFHETFAAACLLLGVLGLVPRFKVPFELTRGRWIGVFLTPLLLFVLFDGLSYWLFQTAHPNATYANPNFSATIPSMAVRWIEGFVSLVGASVCDLLVPQIFTTTMQERRPAILILGPIALFLLGYTAVRTRRWYGDETFVLYLGLSIFLLSFFLGYTTMRILPSSVLAIGSSHYYRFFSNFVFLFMFAILLPHLFGAVGRRTTKIGFVAVLCGLIGNQIFFGVARQHRLGRLTAAREARLVANLENAVGFLGDQYCYQKKGRDLESSLPSNFLYRKSCSLLPGRKPVTAEELLEKKVIVYLPSE